MLSLFPIHVDLGINDAFSASTANNQDRTYLVEIEDEVQLADVPEEAVQDLDEEVDGLEVGQLVVVGVDAHTEEETGVAPIDDLVVPELDEVGLVLLIPGRDEAMDLIFHLPISTSVHGILPRLAFRPPPDAIS